MAPLDRRWRGISSSRIRLLLALPSSRRSALWREAQLQGTEAVVWEQPVKQVSARAKLRLDARMPAVRPLASSERRVALPTSAPYVPAQRCARPSRAAVPGPLHVRACA